MKRFNLSYLLKGSNDRFNANNIEAIDFNDAKNQLEEYWLKREGLMPKGIRLEKE